MTSIHVLDEQTVNQIAAGEVVEGPHAVIKELVDNSLDAGATRIEVETKAGGKSFLAVRDNGCGMTAEDALLSLQRHATSKLRSAEDLARISSMGFRGEALPSIASVSKMTLLTSPASGPATLVLVEGGKRIKSVCAHRDPGTTVEVSALFYNAPARRKFQKSPQRAKVEVHRAVLGHALAHPGVHFRLVQDGAVQIATQAEDFSGRCGELLGKEFLDQCRFVEAKEEGYALKGYVSRANHTKATRQGQTLLINRRLIQNPMISSMVAASYGHGLPKGRHPLFLLDMTIPAAHLDINVHPQKSQVRIRDAARVRSLLFAAVKQSLPVQRVAWEAKESTSSWREFVAKEEEVPYEPSFVTTSFVETALPEHTLLATLPGYLLVSREEALFGLVDVEAALRKVWEGRSPPSQLGGKSRKMTREEGVRLLDALGDATICPLGRPIWVWLTRAQVEKWF